MSKRYYYPFFTLSAALFCSIASLQAAPDRISGPIDTGRAVRLANSGRPAQAQLESDHGRVDPSLLIPYARIVLQPTVEQSAALEQLLEEQRDPSSPNYQRWLTPEEFADKFSVSANDANQVVSWLQSQDFTVEGVARARTWIAFTGLAGQMESAFQTEIHHYRGTGELHFANSTALSIPAALSGIVTEVRGLHDYRWASPRIARLGPVAPNFTAAGAHYLAPDDFATIYDISPLYSAGITGTGQKIAIVGQSNVSQTDLAAFRTQFGLPANPPQMVLYGTDPGVRNGDNVESTLDIEWAGAVARNASLLFVYSTNVILSAEYVVDNKLAPVISMSYGGCEASNSSSLRSLVQQANSYGITWLNSSGDSGAAGCDSSSSASARQGLAVNMPASIPEVTAVGGTTFNEGSGSYWNSGNTASGGSALSYIPEMSWNDATSTGTLSASGGGVSVLFSKPAWQSGTGVPADGARDVPDIAGTASAAHDGYVLYVNGSLEAVGGTSAPTPAYAGVIGLLNQYLLSKGSLTTAGVGNINPTLYHLAQTSSAMFHDVTSGSNIVPCTVGTKNCSTGSLGYNAGVGYDLVTGLGSIDVNRLVTGWSGVISSSVGTTTTLTANPSSFAQNASTSLTATVKPASGTTAPSGVVVFQSGSTVLGSVSLTASGSSGVASLGVAGSSLPLGTDSLTATYGGSSSFGGSSGGTAVSVTSVGGANSNVVATATPNPVTEVNSAWTFNVKLTNSGGATKLTGMTFNGANLSSSITPWFGTNQMAAGGTFSVNLSVRSAQRGAQEVFVFSGQDPSGRTWSTSLTITLN
ncbi:MAG TPA: protease pro-enzyme activation domain-containing protein [Bryobacteraceae bacterium]|jgi:subtilase family serine protease